jgi:hypothetical protein
MWRRRRRWICFEYAESNSDSDANANAHSYADGLFNRRRSEWLERIGIDVVVE